MSPFHLPLSGDVSQLISPWTSWFSGNNSSLFQVNYASSAPHVEEKIIRDVAGYGRQLGKITAALEVLCAIPTIREKLNAEQEKCVQAFQAQADEIRAAKEKMLKEALTPYGLRSLLQNLQTLQQDNPELYNKLTDQIKEALFAREKAE